MNANPHLPRFITFALGLLALLPPAWAQTPSLGIQLDGGQAQLSITGVVNGRYTVQCSADLAQPSNWQVLTNLLLPASPCVLRDAVAAAPGQRFYRVVATSTVITVTDAQLEDMCSRMCTYLNTNAVIPETILISSQNTNAVSAADFHYLMTKWLRYYRDNANRPPANVAIAGGTLCPPDPIGIESGQIYLADILASAETDAGAIDATGALPNCTTVAGVQYTTKAMLWLYARTINWYKNNNQTMPNYATVKPVTAPASWTSVILPTGLKVAVFSDPNGSTDSGCIQATLSILSTNGFNVTTISPASIQTGGLSGYDVVMFPGGSGGGQATALQPGGCAQVAQFVANGGGFIGTCAGAYLAALGYTVGGSTNTYWLELVNAQILDVADWARGTEDTQVQIVNATNAILAGFPTTFTAHYANGPLLGPGASTNLPPYEAEAVYVTDVHDNGPIGVMPGTTAMTTSTYYAGRCVLFGFHPELSSGLEQMEVRAVKWAAGKL